MKEWVEIISAGGQIAIATSVAYIAWRSYALNKAGFYVNKDQLRLVLFDRRFKVYEGFRDYLLDSAVHAKVDDKKLSALMMTTADAEFLFENEIADYRKLLIQKSIRIRQLGRKFEGGIADSKQREKSANELEELEKWMADQFEQLGGKFRKYLRFTIEAHPGSKKF